MTSASAGGRPPGCPSDLALDEMLAGDLAGLPEEARLRGHVKACARCGARAVERRADQHLAPDPVRLRPFVSRPAARARPRARPRWLVGAGGAVGSAAVAGLLLWNHEADPGDSFAVDRAKGALILTVHVKRAPVGGLAPVIEAVNGEGHLRAGEEMRFAITSVRPGHVVVLGLDSAPSVTTYVPAAGGAERPAPVPVRVDAQQSVILPGSLIADDTAGFERIMAVVCQTPTSPAELRRAAEAALARAGGHPERVSSLGSGCAETSVLFRKEPR